MAKFDSYIICTSPRSGSTLLCGLLKATGVAGNPKSYFHLPSLSKWCADFELTPDASLSERDILVKIFQAAIRKGSLDTGMFGLRLQRHSFDFFIKQLAILHAGLSNDALRFRAAFGRTLFIHLTRQDKVGQAVSYVRAQQSGLWHAAPDGTELERLSSPKESVYDADEIQAWFKDMTGYDREWEDWFATEKINPLRITYEELSADPAGRLRYILDNLGLDHAATANIEPGVAKLADRSSRAWVARFRSERGVS